MGSREKEHGMKLWCRFEFQSKMQLEIALLSRLQVVKDSLDFLDIFSIISIHNGQPN